MTWSLIRSTHSIFDQVRMHINVTSSWGHRGLTSNTELIAREVSGLCLMGLIIMPQRSYKDLIPFTVIHNGLSQFSLRLINLLWVHNGNCKNWKGAPTQTNPSCAAVNWHKNAFLRHKCNDMFYAKRVYRLNEGSKEYTCDTMITRYTRIYTRKVYRLGMS